MKSTAWSPFSGSSRGSSHQKTRAPAALPTGCSGGVVSRRIQARAPPAARHLLALSLVEAGWQQPDMELIVVQGGEQSQAAGGERPARDQVVDHDHRGGGPPRCFGNPFRPPLDVLGQPHQPQVPVWPGGARLELGECLDQHLAQIVLGGEPHQGGSLGRAQFGWIEVNRRAHHPVEQRAWWRDGRWRRCRRGGFARLPAGVGPFLFEQRGDLGEAHAALGQLLDALDGADVRLAVEPVSGRGARGADQVVATLPGAQGDRVDPGDLRYRSDGQQGLAFGFGWAGFGRGQGATCDVSSDV